MDTVHYVLGVRFCLSLCCCCFCCCLLFAVALR